MSIAICEALEYVKSTLLRFIISANQGGGVTPEGRDSARTFCSRRLRRNKTESEAQLRIRAAILFVFALLYPGNLLLLQICTHERHRRRREHILDRINILRIIDLPIYFII